MHRGIEEIVCVCEVIVCVDLRVWQSVGTFLKDLLVLYKRCWYGALERVEKSQWDVHSLQRKDCDIFLPCQNC